jgi:hypothetical protein
MVAEILENVLESWYSLDGSHQHGLRGEGPKAA